MKVNDREVSVLCSRHFKQILEKLAVSTSPETTATPEKHSSSNVRGLRDTRGLRVRMRYRKKDFYFSWTMASFLFFSEIREFSIYFKQ